MKERHLRLELAKSSEPNSHTISAIGWNLAARALELGIRVDSLIDVAYKIKENEHPDFGGLELMIAGFEIFASKN
jgi:single-stranded-DNA-specific exonuclease